MPVQYVQNLSDLSIASIESVPEIQAHSIDVSVEGSQLLWQYGNKRLRVNVTALEKASLSVGTFGPNEFVFFTLHFGDPNGGGVRMLHASICNSDCYEDILGILKDIIPCPIEYDSDCNR